MNTDYMILLDKSTPFDDGKIKVLDELLHLFYNSPMNLNVIWPNDYLLIRWHKLIKSLYLLRMIQNFGLMQT
jgi:hypothetical protein